MNENVGERSMRIFFIRQILEKNGIVMDQYTNYLILVLIIKKVYDSEEGYCIAF